MADRVQEGQAAGVESDGLAKGPYAAIAGIAVDRPAPVGQLDAELVRPAGLRPQLQQAQTVMDGPALVMQQGLRAPSAPAGTTSTRPASLSFRSQSSSEPASSGHSPSTTAQ